MSVNIKSLGYIVANICADLNIPITNHYAQFLNWTIQGYRELNLLGLMPTIKAVQIPVNTANNTICLPCDFIDYLRIGVNCNGIFINLDFNDELILQGDTVVNQCPCDANAISTSINAICGCNGQGFEQWAWGWGAGWGDYANYDFPNFGIGPGYYHGGYRINREQNIIQFDSCLTPKVVYMEYKSTGFDINGDAVVPQDAIPSLIEFVHWKRCLFSQDKAQMQLADGFRRRFLIYKQDFECRVDAMNRWEYLDIFRRYTFQAVKT